MRAVLVRAAVVCGWVGTALATELPTDPQIVPARQPERPEGKPLAEPVREGDAPTFSMELTGDLAAQGNFVPEVEPNNTDSTATSLAGSDVLAIGTVFPAADVDWWSFTASAGDRIHAALQTAFSTELANGGNSELRLYRSNGVTLIEFDQDDGTFNDAASSIAGAEIQNAGIYFLQVKHLAAASQLRPYYLHFRRMSGAPTVESEPNDAAATADPIPSSGWVNGVRSSVTDVDTYSIVLGAGDTVFLSLDMDPERNNLPSAGGWDGRLGFGFFGDTGNQVLAADDFATPDSANPRSEALFMTVKYAGTYYITVDSVFDGGSATTTYHLAASVHPAAPIGVNCQTYSSGDVNLPIGPSNGAVTNSTIFVPGDPRIEDLNVSIVLDHAVMSDVDAALLSPAGNQNSLFTDVGPFGPGDQTRMDLELDDEAGVPIGFYNVMKGMTYQPEPDYRLAWFKGERAGGTWTLRLRDDAGPTRGGTLTSWSLTICQPAPQVCEGNLVTVYSSDFETGADGFTHSGTQDEWSRGNPTSTPVSGCNSGTSCWKTDLTGNYNAASNQSLISPNISLAGLTKPIQVSWAQKYQIENASFDTFFVEVREPGPVNARSLFRHYEATMQDFVGSPSTAINESAGWGLVARRIDAYSSKTIQLHWNLTSDSSLFFPGLAVDDVVVTGCQCTAAGCDDGNPCTNDVCDAAQGCLHTIRTGSCSDGNACTSGDTCTSGVCVGTPITCDDGNACTVNTCDPQSGCQFPPIDCSDGNPCTDDECSGGTCTHPNNALPCDDANLCTTADTCSEGACLGTTVDCSDADPCTDDTCLPQTGCQHAPHSCDDGNACTDDSCAPGVGCQHGPHCNDGSACTDDSCDPGTGACSTAPISCDDGNFCTDDSCDPITGCQHTAHSCDDRSACTDDSCDAGIGACSNPPISCDDGNFCTDDSCDPITRCQHTAHSCDDGNACTDDSCDPVNGCQHTAHSCDDADPCTDDTCDPVTGCQDAPHCDDGSMCTTDSCDPGTGDCSTVPISCDDGNVCTDDSCDPATGCQHPPHSCDDGNACTDDSCDPATGCQNAPHSCDDGNACTDDSCDPATGCQHAPHSCDDGNVCTDDSCSPAIGCQYVPHVCDDANACTDDSCSPATGCQYAPHVCDDANACTIDSCDAGSGCQYAALSCDDGDLCTQDGCNAQTGCTHVDRCAHFCNDGQVEIVDGPSPPTVGNPYPSTIVVAGLVGSSSVGSVRLLGLSHPVSEDLDALLVAPGGQNAIFLSDAGGAAPAVTVDLIFRDTASPLPGAGGLVSGAFSPTNASSHDAFPAPAPAPSGQVLLSTFDGLPANGTWSLYLVDDAEAPGSGTLDGGWCLDLLTSCEVDEDCDDGSACTVDSCVNGQCQAAPVSCDDGNACSDDSCDPVTGCQHTAHSCDDGNLCTDDSCDPQTGCQHAPHCDDGSVCTTDSCDSGTGDCSTVLVSCDDANACTDDSCDPVTGCEHATHSCDDANACTDDSCDPVTGCEHATHSCDDANACTDDSCDPVTGCQEAPHCDDGSLCTTDSCDPGTGDCSTVPISCDDGNACTDDSCDPINGCQPTPHSCDDGNLCTEDSCDPQMGCQYAPHCDDGSVCTTDSCDPGTGDCSTLPISCDDGNACTDDSCDSVTGCQHAPHVCDDGDVCTNDTCDAQTGCGTLPVTSPAEVAGLALGPSKQTISWGAALQAVSYDLVRGELAALPVGAGPEVCLGAFPATIAEDAQEPLESAGFWYLVRGVNTCAAPGTYGNASSGAPRGTAACP